MSLTYLTSLALKDFGYHKESLARSLNYSYQSLRFVFSERNKCFTSVAMVWSSESKQRVQLQLDCLRFQVYLSTPLFPPNSPLLYEATKLLNCLQSEYFDAARIS